MCGRTAQTLRTARAAAEVLGAPQPPEESREDDGSNQPRESNNDENSSSSSKPPSNSTITQDNYNLSPGMDAIVFTKSKDGKLMSDRKVWGLITKHGSTKNPLPTGMGQHFSALMYNARSDTLYMKQTFGNLIGKQQSCIVAVDGWFEWKQELKGKKQPYFCKDANRPYLLLPGLWTQVSTGRPEDPYLDTFTILTTEATSCMKWLHSRMPVCCFSNELAHQWLDSPTQKVHEALLDNHEKHHGLWDWHTVTDEMTSLKFRSEKSIALWKRPTIKSFFAAKKSSPEKQQPRPSKPTTTKRRSSLQSSTPTKKAKTASPAKGTIADFFVPKKK